MGGRRANSTHWTDRQRENDWALGNAVMTTSESRWSRNGHSWLGEGEMRDLARSQQVPCRAHDTDQNSVKASKSRVHPADRVLYVLCSQLQ